MIEIAFSWANKIKCGAIKKLCHNLLGKIVVERDKWKNTINYEKRFCFYEIQFEMPIFT